MAFNEQTYLQNKLNQLNTDPNARQQAASLGWTGGSTQDLANFMARAGMTPQQHYQQFGRNEGLISTGTMAGQQTSRPAAQPMTQPQSTGNWQSDWNGFFSDAVAPGTVVDLGNGSRVTRMHDGSAVYQNPSGAWVQFNQSSHPGDVGRHATGLANNWQSNRYLTESWHPVEGSRLRPDQGQYGFTVNNGIITHAAGGTRESPIYYDLTGLSPEARRFFETNPMQAAIAMGTDRDLEKYFRTRAVTMNPAGRGTVNHGRGAVNMGGSGSGLSSVTSGSPFAAGAGNTTFGREGGNVGFGVSSPQGSLSSALANDATIQGRMNNLLATDQFGNYTNQVVRQAAERAMQSFAGRGLLNSSMAMQAAQEAAIAKAIEIVGADAGRAFEQSRANQDAQNQFALQDRRFGNDMERMREEFAMRQGETAVANNFNLRNNYVTAVQNVTADFNRQVQQINASNMSPADRDAAIAQAAATRDGELAFINQMFSRMPDWQSQWLAVAVPTTGASISSVTDRNSLINIINDPAQPEAIRQQAQARLTELQATQTA